MERWVGKTAVVTGAGAGIGAGVAAALADAGLRVVAIDVKDEAAIDDAVNRERQRNSEGSVTARQCDVTDPAQLQGAFRWLDEQLGGVHVLVSSAGMLFPGHITDVGSHTLSVEKLSTMLDVNTKALVMCAKHAVASMNKHGVDGHVVNINSLAGHYVPFASEMNVYAASKHAVTAFSEALAQELAHFHSGIKVTSVSPGLVRSSLGDEMLSTLGREPARALQPRDVAGAVLYALSTPSHVNVNLHPELKARADPEDPRARTLVANCRKALVMSIFSFHRGDGEDESGESS